MEGKFFIHRKIFESDVWEKPAYFLKVWIWIIGKANWKEVRKEGKIYHRGEFMIDYGQIIKRNQWKTGWRTEYLTKDQIFSVLEFLRKTQRIHTTKTTRGLWIKVLNYDYFQRLPKGEGNNENDKEGNSKTTEGQHRKRKKNEIQMKEISSLSFKELSDAYKQGKREYKPFFEGSEMRWSQSRWWVIENGQWLEFAGEESEIEWRQKPMKTPEI